MKTVNFYTKNICSLCDEAEALLYMFQQEYSFNIKVRDIYTNDEWLEAYHLRIPVIEIGEHKIDCEKMSYHNLQIFLKNHT